MFSFASSAFVIWLAAASGFADHVSCVVQGYVDAGPDRTFAFTRVDSCPGVRHRIEDNALYLWSPHQWAVIVLPLRGEHVRLTYRWGSPSAHLEASEQPVAWGRVSNGGPT
jgi:hypothetical protein